MTGFDFYKKLKKTHRAKFRKLMGQGFGFIQCTMRECSSMTEFLMSARKLTETEKAYWIEVAKEYEP